MPKHHTHLRRLKIEVHCIRVNLGFRLMFQSQSLLNPIPSWNILEGDRNRFPLWVWVIRMSGLSMVVKLK